ncbi:MAG: hypothetical protein U0470_06675 [Anaerolineae bacterium]
MAHITRQHGQRTLNRTTSVVVHARRRRVDFRTPPAWRTSGRARGQEDLR